MVVGFTGTQHGALTKQKETLHKFLHKFYVDGAKFIHGDCIGADHQAHNQAVKLGYEILKRPCNIKNKRAFTEEGIILNEEMSPLERNKLIVSDCEILLACPKEYAEQRRSGTWATIRYAKEANKRIIIIYPDGSYEDSDIDKV